MTTQLSERPSEPRLINNAKMHYRLIALTGIDGKPFASWQSADSQGAMWLRDCLPWGIAHLHVQLYGYEAALQGSKSTAGLADYTAQFLETLCAGEESAVRKVCGAFLVLGEQS